MKRFIFTTLFSALFMCCCIASINPPVTELNGWHVFGPDGGSGTVTNPPSCSTPGSLSSEVIAEILSTSGGPLTPSFDIDLATDLPAASTDMIAELARALDNNITLCYIFVRNNIRYTPYAGIVRGPVRTLIDREGNSADQAFLLLSLLRASGFEATVYFDPYFNINYANSEDGYDAASWIGVSPTGTVAQIQQRLYNILQPSGVNPEFYPQSTPESSDLSLNHYYVVVNWPGYGDIRLDPSYKPRCKTSPDFSIINETGYNRTNLLNTAGGTVTNDWFVKGISMSALTNELQRLTTNLVSCLHADQANNIDDLLGKDEIIPQDFSTDRDFFHGDLSYFYYDFLDQSDSFKNDRRAWIKISNEFIDEKIWIDELAGRSLWISYTNIPGCYYPVAVLHLDDDVISMTEFGGWTDVDKFEIGIHHPSITTADWVNDLYYLECSVTNTYAVPLGFGETNPYGMRGRIAGLLSELNCGESSDGQLLRSTLLQSLGYQWIYQSEMIRSVLSLVGKYPYHTFFRTGIVGEGDNSYFDFKTGVAYTSADTYPDLYGGNMFLSTLEHSVLDQNNGIERAALSTVRVMDLANMDDIPIYLTSSSNWSSVEAVVSNFYSPGTISWIGDQIEEGQKFLLPENGEITLNDWTGFGLFMFGTNGTSSLIGGGLGGGDTSVAGQTEVSKVDDGGVREKNQDGTVKETKALDPISMCKGAALADRTDLAVKGPSPLIWKRHYDSRQRFSNGSLGRGWNHGYDSRIVIHSDPDAFIGRDMPASCAASVVACMVVDDLTSMTNNAKSLTTASLVTKWWTDQLLDNAATVTVDGKALSFCRLPDGTYEPQPGVTATLTGSPTTGFTLEERLGSTWIFSTNGVLDNVEDRSGNTLEFTYTNGTQLVSVANDFGDQIDIEWTGDKITSVSDSAERTLTYVYSADGCLTGVTDVAGYVWTMSYDTEGNLLSETDPEGIVTVQNTYNGIGQVTNQISASGYNWGFAYADGWRSWEEDPLGNRTYHGFTSEGRNSWRIDRDGAVHMFSYDSSGHMVTNIDAIGRTHVSVYDNDNHLVRLTEAANTPDARTTSFAYDAQHHLIAKTNALGRVTHMSYDGSDRLAMMTTPDGVSVTNSYDTHGLLTSAKTLNVSGQTIRAISNVYNGNGRVTQSTATDAGTTHYTYDSAGNVVSITDACGNPTGFSYDNRGFATNVVNALEHSTSTIFSEAGRPVYSTDPLGHTTSFLWTPGGKPSATIFDDESIITNVYDIADRLIAVTDQRDSIIILNLDAMGRVTNRTASTWSDYTWYDAAGVVTARQDAVGGVTKIDRDWLERPVAFTDPLSQTSLTYYDPLNSVTNTVDPRGRDTQHTYDIMGRLTRNTRPSGYAENYGLDALGRTVAYTNAEGRVTTQSFDAQSRLLSTVNAAGERLFLNSYDNVGNLTNRLDGADNPTVYEYDALNRNTSVTYSDDTTEAFTYDAVGNLTSADNGSVSNSFTYDSMNRLTEASVEWQMASVSKQVEYRYDIGGLVTNIVYPGSKTLHYAYDTDGRLSSITDWNSNTFTFSHDAAGRLTRLVYPNGVIATNTYDAAHRLTSWKYSKSGSTLAGRTITRDAAGIKTGESVTAGLFPNPTQPRRTSNTFDVADRLTSAVVYSGTNTFNESYQYNANGALTNCVRSQEADISSQAAYTYDHAHRFTSATLTNALTQALTHLIVSYDALGNRTRTVQNGTTRLWMTDYADPLKRLLMETDTSGNPVRYYIWGGGRLLAIIESDGTIHYTHSDELGSVVALTDSSGTVTDQFSYGPYGENWGRSGTTDIPFRWLGSHGVFAVSPFTPHTSHFVYLTRHRAYDSSTTRFLSADPLALGGGPNLYSYCLGSPLSYIDPLGLCGENIAAAAWEGFFDADAWMAGGMVTANIITFGSLYGDGAAVARSEYYDSTAGKIALGAGVVGREALGAAITMGTGTAARSGSAGAQLAYKGLLVAEAGSGGYMIGEGGVHIAEGEYIEGATDILGGALRVGGAVGGASILDAAPTPQSCFLAGTLVATEEGDIPIENISKGDMVWSYDFSSESWCLAKVDKPLTHQYRGDLITIHVEGGVVKSTGNHPFWVAEGRELEKRPRANDVSDNEQINNAKGRWVEARDLRRNDILVLKNGCFSVVTNIELGFIYDNVFNLSIEDCHNYAVSKLGILVHNKSQYFGNFKKLKDSKLKSIGVDAHAAKADYVGKANVSKYNISVDNAGAVILTPVKKGGAPVSTGMSIDEMGRLYPRSY